MASDDVPKTKAKRKPARKKGEGAPGVDKGDARSAQPSNKSVKPLTPLGLDTVLTPKDVERILKIVLPH